jgi:thiamine monophosphate synthase
VPLLINDRLDVALALDAAGVHLAGHSLPTAVARQVLGAGKLLGVSTHSVEEPAVLLKMALISSFLALSLRHPPRSPMAPPKGCNN